MKRKVPKERNPFVEAMRFRKSGKHVKDKRNERRKEKLALKKLTKEYA